MYLRYDTYTLKARSYCEVFFRSEGQEEGARVCLREGNTWGNAQ